MSVKVAVRVRPFNKREQSLNCECCIDMKDPATILKPHKGEAERVFTFDYSFWSFDEFKEESNGMLVPTGNKYADQTQVFNRIGKNILDNAWEGYHCCLFAYGQTGSGKSYSMIGYGPNKGIVPITCNELFERAKNKEEGQEFEVHASMLEIYNEEIQDLTIPIASRVQSGLKIRENKLLGVYVDGVKKHLVTTFEEIENVMAEGTKNRTVAATQMNATSSRAHTIITVEFIQRKKVGQAKSEKISMINLVDLAGSERQDKTGATGQRLKEAVGINQSLTSLGQVISVLAKNSEGANEFVPYRNSALTRILQNALGGNSKTIMICAISPATDNYEESLSTLRYADSAKKIKNKPIVNESQSDKMIRQLKEENDRLKKLLEGKGGSLQTEPTQQVNTVDTEEMKKKEEQMKKKEQEFKKKEEELKKKETEQAAKLKALEQSLKQQEAEKAKILAEKETEMKALEEKIRAEEDAEQAEELKKLLEEKAKEEEELKKKALEQSLQQKEQEKALAQQTLLLQKSQEDYRIFMEEMKKAREEAEKKAKEEAEKKAKEEAEKKAKQQQKQPELKPEQQTSQNEKKPKDNDKDEEAIKADIEALNKLIKNSEMGEAEKKKEAEKDQADMKKLNHTDGLLSKKQLKEIEKNGGKLPPYFENISKDVMINRKLKILLQKSVLTVGKVGCHPPNDIVFGGRDVNIRHATIHVIEDKVFLKPVSANSHLYVNGNRVEGTVELMNLDRVIFGWNSVYLFKNKHDNRTNETIKAREITWDFVREEMQEIVDIDQSDTEDGEGGCCRLF